MSAALPTPSAADVAALAAMAAAAVPPGGNLAAMATAPVSSVLSEVFHLCRHPWVHNFIFTDDMSPLVALTAPLNQNASMACFVRFANVDAADAVASPTDVSAVSSASTASTSSAASAASEPSSTAVATSTSPFNMSMTGDFVFVPAFSAGSIGVGFGIHKCCSFSASKAELMSICGPPPTELSHFRFVRDDAASLLIIVHEDKERGIVKIDYMKNITATTRRRAFICLSRPALQPFLDARAKSPSSTPPSPPLNAVLVCESGTETRACPSCQAPRGSWCSCPLDVPVPQHPFDFDTVKRCMISHTGSFEGIANAHFCPSQPYARVAMLGSRIMVDPRPDETDLVARFTKWAISDHLNAKPISPLQDVVSLPANALLGDVDRPDESKLTACAYAVPQQAALVPAGDMFGAPDMSAFFAASAPPPPAPDAMDRGVSTFGVPIANNDILVPDSFDTPPKFGVLAQDTRPVDTSGDKQEDAAYIDNPAQMRQPSLFDTPSTPSVSIDYAALNVPSLDVNALLREALGDTTDSTAPQVKKARKHVTSAEKLSPSPVSSLQPSGAHTTACSPLQPASRSSADSIADTCLDGPRADEGRDSAPDSMDEDEHDDQPSVSPRSAPTRDNATPIAPRVASAVQPLHVLQARAAPVLPRPLVPSCGSSANGHSSDSLSNSKTASNSNSAHSTLNGASLAQSVADTAAPAGTGEKDRERRAQLRRQRNREAAQRSNLRRKIRNDTLKKNLRDSQSLAAELRARELLLREENLKLRKLLP